MKNFSVNVFSFVKNTVHQGYEKFIHLTVFRKIAVIVGVLVILLVVVHFAGSTSDEGEVSKGPREVTTSLVSSLSNANATIPLLGTVTSLSEATIRTESSGKLTRVYKKLGDYVSAGEVIAEFENSAERAALLQAEGVYDAAKASRDIAKINSGTTDSSLLDTKTTVLNTISSAYITLDDAVRVKTDTAFTNPRNADTKLAFTLPDANLQFSLESQRKAIEKMLTTREAENKTLTINSDLFQELNSMLGEAQTVKAYLDDLASAYAKAIPDTTFSQTTLDTNRASLGLARTAVASTIATMISSRTTLQASISAQEISGKTLSNSGTSIATADAAVKQAEGAYNAALSRLQKTIIRSPLSGTLNSLSIQTGDYVSQFTPVAVVSNNKALEIVSYVTEEDAKRIPVGTQATIEGNTKGVVTRIASALDSTTKKIEVRIGIVDKATSLVNGQSVRISITPQVEKITKNIGVISIPLSALKITPQGSNVFIVSTSSTLVAIPVQIGALEGQNIQILSGITDDISIVTDARGLKDGEVVSVKQ